VRVVAGELGGRRLLSPPRGSDVRPTADRVREALFAMLGDVSGAQVLDLFCGTGALGIEALSRGAERATFVDSSIGPAERNVHALGLRARARLVRSDALEFLRRDAGSYDLVLCDPPYRLARRIGPELDQLLRERLADGGRVVVEAAAREPVELGSPPARERRYGDTVLRIWEGLAR
jgi:16S rRNA (guanine966-N2)-methyltransferase